MISYHEFNVAGYEVLELSKKVRLSKPYLMVVLSRFIASTKIYSFLLITRVFFRFLLYLLAHDEFSDFYTFSFFLLALVLIHHIFIFPPHLLFSIHPLVCQGMNHVFIYCIFLSICVL